MDEPSSNITDLTQQEYRALSEFRHQIRLFLLFSEEAARTHGVEPQQHQLLLAIQGLPAGQRSTIAVLAERMGLRHHSTVELVNRLAEHMLVERTHGEEDKREVIVRILPAGEMVLKTLSLAHREELSVRGPGLARALRMVMPPARSNMRRPA